MKKFHIVLSLSLISVSVLSLLAGCGQTENKDLAKAKNLIEAKDYDKATLAAQAVLKSQPADEEAVSILESLKLSNSINSQDFQDLTAASNSIQKIINSSIHPLENQIKEIEAKGELDEDEIKDLERLTQRRNYCINLVIQSLEGLISDSDKSSKSSKSSKGKKWDLGLLTNSDPDHIKLLVDLCLLAKKSPSIRTRSISDSIITRLSKSSESYLIESLKNPDSSIRQSAVEFLGKLRSPTAIQSIADLLEAESSFEVAYLIPIVLSNIGGDEVIAPFIRCLKSEVAQTRIYAANLLGQMKVEAAVEPLIMLLADDNGYVRRSASDALVQIGEPVLEPLIRIHQTQALDFPLPPTALISKDAERNRRNSLRMEIITTLGKLRNHRVPAPLISSLNDKDVNASSISALTSLGSIAVEALIAALQNSDEMIRANSALILGNIGDTRATTLLISALEDPVKEVRGNAALALSKLRPKAAIRPLTQALKSDETTKLNAIIALGNIGTKDDLATTALIKIVTDKLERDTVRVEAINALSKIKDNRAIQPLINLMLNDDEPDKVRQSAAYFLGEIKASEAVEPMLRILESLRDDVEDFQRHIKSKYNTIEALNAAWKSRYAKWTDIKPAPSLLRSESAVSLGKIKTDTKDEKVVDRLLEVLKEDERASVRKSAAWALGAIKGDKVVEPLIKALKDDKRGMVRNEAAVALEKIKGDKVVEPLIGALLDDKYETTRKSAAIALREIKDKRAIEPLIKVIKGEHRSKSSEEKESEAVMAAVMSCFDNDKIAKPAIQPMIELLAYEDPMIRIQAATALGNIQSSAATASLINGLSDENPAVRNAIAIALGKIKDKKALNSQKGLIPLVKAEREYSRIKASVIGALGEMKDESAIEILIESLSDPSEEVRMKSAIALGKIKDRRPVIRLMQILDNKLERETVKNAAIEALGEIADPKAAPFIVRFIDDSDDDTASKAILALGKLKYSEAVVPLIKILEDRSRLGESIRKSAAIALKDIGDRGASEAILKRLIDKTEYKYTLVGDKWHNIFWQEVALAAGEFLLPEAAPILIERAQDMAEPEVVRYISALALGKTQAPTALDVLKQLLNDDLEIVRAHATSGLGETKRKEALDILAEIMENTGKSEAERVHAARGLGVLGEPKAVPSLIKAMNESNNHPVRLEATTSLGKLGGDQAVAALVKVLSDENLALKFRRRAAEALGEAKNKLAVSALETALKHQDAELHFQAAKALYSITKNGYGYQFF